MRRLESLDDVRHRVVTLETTDGRRVRVDERAYRELGIDGIAKYLGEEMPTERERVFQHGQCVGTVPPGFDPLAITSNTFLYDVRRGDFIRSEDGWIANRMLGGGDLEAIPGFVWEVAR